MTIDTYQQFIYKRTYSRWLEEEGRREEWHETVARYGKFFRDRVPDVLKPNFSAALDAVSSLRVMPSMRALWSAGLSLELENVVGFNCSYTTIEKPKDFAEILYILMCGAGVGFSVERQFINRLPAVPDELIHGSDVIVVEDSRLGWAEAYLEHLNSLYAGVIRPIDYSRVRRMGAPLKTSGGRASGPEPLKQLFDFIINVFQQTKGRKLNSLEVYDIVTMTANIVTVGGVRRSATISLSNLSDQRMKGAKEGQFWIDNPHRALSNNSVAYTEKPEILAFMDEWMALVRSGSGERGIMNRVALQKSAHAIGRDPRIDYGVNPCGEVILRSKQFCNLTEVVLHPDDTMDDFLEKIEHAVLLGLLQTTLTNYQFLDEEWLRNVQDDPLLGVSLTGLRDHPVLGSTECSHWLQIGRRHAHKATGRFARKMGVKKPKAVTTVKPSGTVSQLTNTSSGMHARYASYYIRRVRVTVTDPLVPFLIDNGVKWSPEVGQTQKDMTTVVFDFPIKSFEGAQVKGESALEQLEYWKLVKLNWTDHNPSATVYVGDHEWLEVGAWVYRNFDIIGGLTFLPDDGGVYQLAPYEAITREKYEELIRDHPESLDWRKLSEYEKEDRTTGFREYACRGDKCEI